MAAMAALPNAPHTCRSTSSKLLFTPRERGRSHIQIPSTPTSYAPPAVASLIAAFDLHQTSHQLPPPWLWVPPPNYRAQDPYSDEPPPHQCPLYNTIPLPDNDSPAFPKGCGNLQGPSTSAARTIPLLRSRKRHVSPRVTLNAFLVEILAEKDRPSLQALAARLTRNLSAPATYPPAQHLTILLAPTGQSLYIRPSAIPRSSFISVKDVFRMLEHTHVVLYGPNSLHLRHSMYGGSEDAKVERILCVVESLSLRWVGPNDGGDAVPWHIVVERR